MQLAPRTQGAPRLTGIGLVVLIHLVIVWAMANGLMRAPISTPKPPPVDVIPTIDREPPPPTPVVIQKPTLSDVTPIFIDPPPINESQPAPVQQATPSDSPLTPSVSGTGRPASADITPAVPASGRQAVLANPAMICSKMGKPDVPAVNWSGEAVFKAIATVRSGRVVGADIRVLSGSVDSKSRRALQSAIATALQDTYECPGNHQFEQEFQFRID